MTLTQGGDIEFNTPNSPEATPMITKLVDVLHENLPDKLPQTRDVQHTINLVPGASLSDFPHHKIDPTMHIELK